MNYKQFLDWYNRRACDGCWGFNEARVCSTYAQELYRTPFWRRKKRWKELIEHLNIVELIVEPINKKIEEFSKGE